MDALLRSQRPQPPGLHRRARDQLHAPHLGQRRQHQEPFHPCESFTETLARPPAKGEIGIPGGARVWWGCPLGGDERLRSGKKARIVMHQVWAEEEEAPWREALVPDRHLLPRPPRDQHALAAGTGLRWPPPLGEEFRVDQRCKALLERPRIERCGRVQRTVPWEDQGKPVLRRCEGIQQQHAGIKLRLILDSRVLRDP
jgi:hypothetical protein